MVDPPGITIQTDFWNKDKTIHNNTADKEIYRLHWIKIS